MEAKKNFKQGKLTSFFSTEQKAQKRQKEDVCRSPVKKMKLDSSNNLETIPKEVRRSPRKNLKNAQAENVTRLSPRKLDSNFQGNRNERSPLKATMVAPSVNVLRRSPRKLGLNLDVKEPRRSPRKAKVSECSPKKSPLKMKQSNFVSPSKLAEEFFAGDFSVVESPLHLEKLQRYEGTRNQIEPQRSPRKANISQCSPKKLGSPKKAPLQTKQSNFISPSKLADDFADEFFAGDFSFVESSLHLEKLQRYEVLNVEGSKLHVKSLLDPLNSGFCIVERPWNEYEIKVGDIISLRGVLKDKVWIVDWNGLLVWNADHLISSTQIVQSLFCSRKTVLSSLFDEIGERDCELMVLGCIVHELLQEVLRRKVVEKDDMIKIFNEIVHADDFMIKLFFEKMDYKKTLEKIQSYLPKISEFVDTYVSFNKRTLSLKKDENWNGEVLNIKDIEENIWSPTLGMKGKIDATLQVKVNKKTKLMPLELKTGKVSFSMAHRGQVILYCMLLRDLGESVDSGLLLYLRDEGGIKEIGAGEKEMRDLTLLRNGLSFWLAHLNQPGLDKTVPQLPPPINRRSCESCGHLIACSAFLRMDGMGKLKDNILVDLAPKVTSHLTQAHLDYIFRMVALQTMENEQVKSSVSRLWKFGTEEREENRWCVGGLEVESCEVVKGGNFQVSYVRKTKFEEIFTVGQTVVVSEKNHVATAIGFVLSIEPSSIKLSQDKFLKPGMRDISLDSYESNTLLISTRKNLGLFLENTPIAESLRESIIDLKIPNFKSKLSSKVKKLGQEIMEKLNREQCRAVLQALTAEKFILVKGMAGTGKSTTTCALVRLLVAMGNRVLITSYTHSAVDNILIKLKDLSPLRIGSESRIHPLLKDNSEKSLVEKIQTPTSEKLENAYKAFKVIGVTCYGASHLWLQRQTFDYCIVDEATQMTQVVVLRPLFISQKFVLIGDPDQLPPLVINKEAKKSGLGESLFKRLDRPAVTTVLKRQYRMNKVINELANGFSYEGYLECGDETVAESRLDLHSSISSPEWKYKTLSSKIEHSVILLDVRSKQQSTTKNYKECDFIEEIAKDFLKLGVKHDSIGVIATYKDQVNEIKARLSNIEVNSVDQYQGRDKDIILYSTSKNSNFNPDDITSDKNRLTVAITRAKKKFVLVCDKSFIEKYENFRNLFSCISPENIISTE